MRKLYRFIMSFLLFSLLTVTFNLDGLVYAEKIEGGFAESDIIFWELDTETKTLTISGNGEIPYERGDGYPFKQYNTIGEDDLIQHVVIDDGITKIRYSMAALMSDCTVKLGKDVESVSLHGTVVSVSVHPDNPYYEIYDDCLYTEDRTELVFWPKKKSTDLPPELRKGVARLGGDVFTFSEGNESLMIYDDCIYSADGTELLKCPGNKSVFSFHPELKYIGGDAFGELPGADILIVPWGVTGISPEAFSGVGVPMGNVKIVLPDTITEVRRGWKGEELVIYRENTVVHSGNNPVLNSELEYQLLVSIEDLSSYYGEVDSDISDDETVIVSPPATGPWRIVVGALWLVSIGLICVTLVIRRFRN